MTGFCNCLFKFVCFPSFFKISFYFKKIVITRSYIECLIGYGLWKKGKSEIRSVESYSKKLYKILRDWPINVYLYRPSWRYICIISYDIYLNSLFLDNQPFISPNLMGKWVSIVSLLCTYYDKQPLFICRIPYLREGTVSYSLLYP